LPGESAANWEVRVFASDDLNAFALPGRKIGVYTGLLKAAQNQNQLATVIGHEVAHVLAKHGNERMSTNFAAETGLQLVSVLAGDPGSAQSQTVMALLGLGTQVGVLLPFSRAQEEEADILGLDLMAEAGFDPSASVELWQNMAAMSEGQPPEFLSTHPGTQSRIQALSNRMPRAINLQQEARARGRNPDCRQ
jgi:predicted Zn-dependent protease